MAGTLVVQFLISGVRSFHVPRTIHHAEQWPLGVNRRYGEQKGCRLYASVTSGLSGRLHSPNGKCEAIRSPCALIRCKWQNLPVLAVYPLECFQRFDRSCSASTWSGLAMKVHLL